MDSIKFHFKRFIITIAVITFFLTGCYAPKFAPQDLGQYKTPEELGQASRQAYQKANNSTNKTEKVDQAHAGMAYAEKCLKENSKDLTCLYFNVLNTGIFIQNYYASYQKALKKMVAECQTVISLQPSFEEGGCYRVLGNIYAKVPSFSLSSKGVTQDLEKAEEYLRRAVQVAPNYALNHLFLSRTLETIGEREEAKKELAEFDRLATPSLDSEYANWKKERNDLARKLQLGNKKF